MTDALKQHWPVYLIEGACLGLFMISAFTFGTLLEHPASLVHQTISNPHLRRLLMGIAMGLTAITIIYSPWGKQSGAHINRSTTFTFFRLRKVAKWDAIFYILCQFVGALAGAVLAATLTFKLGRTSLSQLRNHPPRHGWRQRGFFRRGGNYFYFYVSDLESFEPRKLA